MGLFYARPLAAGCLLLIATVMISALLSLTASLLIFALILFAFLMLIMTSALRGTSYRRFYLLVLVICMLFGSARMNGERYFHERELTNAIGDTLLAELEVERVTHNGLGAELLVRVTKMNEDSLDGKALLSLSSPSPFIEGDQISGQFQVHELSEDAYYEHMEYTRRSEGCAVLLTSPKEDEILLLSSKGSSFMTRLSEFRLSISLRILANVGGEAGRLMGALLLGTDELLSNATVSHFRRAGVSHLLALSGLHLTIVVGLLDRLLLFLRSDRKWRMIACTLLMLFYLILTGFSYSMLRAVFMLASVYLAFYLRRGSDALTALLLSGSLILLVVPRAIFDLSFDLTFLATLGVLVFGKASGILVRYIPKGEGAVGMLLSALRMFCRSILISVGVSFMIMPVQWFFFGEFSLLTPLSNLLLLPFVTVLPVLAVFSIPTHAVSLLYLLGGKLAELMLLLLSKLASLNAMASLCFDFVPYILFPCFFACVVLLLVKLKKDRGYLFLPVACFAVCFLTCFAVHTSVASDRVDLFYHASGNDESIVCYQPGNHVIIDISSGHSRDLRESFEILQEKGATGVDTLVLTHYHNAHVAALSRFFASVSVDRIFLPMPIGEEEQAILDSLLAIAASFDVAVRIIEYGQSYSIFDGGSICFYEPLYEKRSTQPAVAFKLSYGGEVFAYESASTSEYLRHRGDPLRDYDADLLLLGRHGPLPKEEIVLAEGRRDTRVLVGREDMLSRVTLPHGASVTDTGDDWTYRME